MTRSGRGLVAVTLGAVLWLAPGARQAAAEDKQPEKQQGKLTMAQVKREAGKCWIEGVPVLRWGAGKECTCAGALEAALSVTAHPVSYEEIMGLSGLAFRVRWGAAGKLGKYGWCPSTPVGEFPEEIEATQARTGWRFDVDARMDREKDPHMEDRAADIRAAIESGIPVPAYPTSSNLNMGVIFGYQDEGKTWLVRDYFAKDGTTLVPIEKLGPMIIIPREHKPVARREAVLAALKTAVTHWGRGSGPEPKCSYLYGEAALAQWARDLALPDTPGGLTEKETKELFFLNWWNFSQWTDARQAAAKFLANAAKELGGHAGAELRCPAWGCNAESEDLGSVYASKDAFLGPWSGKGIKDWTAEVRKRERELLQQAAMLEQGAAGLIGGALRSCGVYAPVQHGPVIVEFLKEHTDEADLNPIRTELLSRLVCMRASGFFETDYDTLVVLSGYATSFAYHPKKYWIMYRPPDSPPETQQRIVAGTGFGWEALSVKKDADKAWHLIVETLDSGRPLQASWMDDFIIAGYQDAAEKQNRKLYVLGKWAPPNWMPWKDLEEWAQRFGWLSRPSGEVKPPQDLTREMLAKTVAWSHGDGRSQEKSMAEGAFGLAGIEAYAADVADASKPPEHFDDGWLNCHAINRQTSGRKCASNWLARVAGGMKDPAASALRTASAQYASAYAAWGEFRTAMLGDAKLKLEAAQEAWRDPQRRAAGAAAIRKAIENERKAVATVEQALEALKAQ